MVNPYQQYKQTQVHTAPPETLVAMLYEGALKHLEQARQLIQAGEDPGPPIIRAQNILVELMNGINLEAGEIAKNLHALYDYYLHRLVQAYGRRDLDALSEVIRHLRGLHDTWVKAVQVYRSEQVAQGAR